MPGKARGGQHNAVFIEQRCLRDGVVEAQVGDDRIQPHAVVAAQEGLDAALGVQQLVVRGALGKQLHIALVAHTLHAQQQGKGQ